MHKREERPFVFFIMSLKHVMVFVMLLMMQSKKYARLQEMVKSFIAQQPLVQPAISHWKTSKGDLVVWNQRRPFTGFDVTTDPTFSTPSASSLSPKLFVF